MSRKPLEESTRPTQATLAAVLQVRDDSLQVLLWQRGLPPFAGSWALPGGVLADGETLESSIRRHLATKVDISEVGHLEQVATYSAPGRNPLDWEIATAYLGLVPLDLDPSMPDDTRWHPVDDLPATAFDHGQIVHAARDRLRGKLSYSNIGFALAPATFTLNELRAVYAAALGYDVSATNLKRVLLRRGALTPTGGRRDSGRAGGRPAEEFAFTEQVLEITDPFAALRPPDSSGTSGASAPVDSPR
jgi:ADP-ribose pyrophosphatase YjhB (NUDIX family)